MPRKNLKLPPVPVEFLCINCDGTMTVTKQPKLFCSDLCQQEAKFIRYYRSCSNDGRINQLDVQMALQIRMAHILSGGYKASERAIPLLVRNAIYKRDNKTCRLCERLGTDIDHINGSSFEMNNLQVLCKDCHSKKTKSNFRELTPEVDNYDEKKAKIKSLHLRAESETPQKICDDEINWNTNQKIILAEMRQLILNERFLAFSRSIGVDTSDTEKKVNRAKNLEVDKIIGLLK
jgi:5-methylcytosine-specific restriction endonuclease McrA